MAIPLIIWAGAALGSYFLSGCGDENDKKKNQKIAAGDGGSTTPPENENENGNGFPDESPVNDGPDTFVMIERVSVSSDGVQQERNPSYNGVGVLTVGKPSISADGRFVAFESLAPNLVPGDNNLHWDVFVRDRSLSQTHRVSVSSDGTEGNDSTGSASISADGRFVAFKSFADDLILEDTNNKLDVFVHDRQMEQTSRVSVSSRGEEGNRGGSSDLGNISINADGRFVTFESAASNLVPEDTNNELDVFVHDRQTEQTSRISVSSSGEEGNDSTYNASISADGRFVAFHSYASNLVPRDTNNRPDVFVRDRQTEQTSRISVSSSGGEANFGSYSPSISADGRFVTFVSIATNLVPEDTNGAMDVFVHDRQFGKTHRVSVNRNGEESVGDDPNYHFSDASISADGRSVAFLSNASDLVPGDTNDAEDVFVVGLDYFFPK
ncbi:MAG: hypothetical protein Q8P84_05085 [Deltaproteobacteria bacterium]|nr:hypothetical protein [Deltaproteobacteria bacterium]